MCGQRIMGSTLWVWISVALLGWTAEAFAAANLTVDNTNPSSVSATYSGGTDTTPITGQGIYTATSTGIEEADTSSATATVSDTGNTLALSQSDPLVLATVRPAAAPLGTTDSGSETLYFRVAANTGFSLSGSYATELGTVGLLAVSPDTQTPATTELTASLMDVTTSSSIFSEDKTGMVGDTLTLDPQTGTLNANDLYEFQASASIFVPFGFGTDPTGSGTISFAMTPPLGPGGGSSVPLPEAMWSALAALFAAAVASLRMDRRTSLV